MNFFKNCGEGKHKFKPRFDKVAPAWMANLKKVKIGEDAIKDLYETHYVCDICQHCGKVIDREEDSP